MPSAVMPRRPLSLPYTKENPMKRKWMMVLGFLPLLMGIPPSHHLDAAPGLYLSKAGMALPKAGSYFLAKNIQMPFPTNGNLNF